MEEEITGGFFERDKIHTGEEKKRKDVEFEIKSCSVVFHLFPLFFLKNGTRGLMVLVVEERNDKPGAKLCRSDQQQVRCSATQHVAASSILSLSRIVGLSSFFSHPTGKYYKKKVVARGF